MNHPVIRLFYLSPELDEKLRVRAFRTGRSQNDITVDAVRAALEEPIEHPCLENCKAGCTSRGFGYGDPHCLDEQERRGKA